MSLKAPVAYQALSVVQQTDFDVTVGQCVVSGNDLARAILIRHETLSDGKSVCSHSN